MKSRGRACETPIIIAGAMAVGSQSRIPRRKMEEAMIVREGESKNGRAIIRAERRMIQLYIRDSFQNRTERVLRRIVW